MNTFTQSFPPVSAKLHNQIVQTVTVTEEPVATSRQDSAEPLWLRSTLNGYDATMRRFAAACEAGR